MEIQMIMNNYSMKKKLLLALLLLGALSAFPLYHAFTPTKKNLAIFTAKPTQQQIQETVQSIATQGSTVVETLAEQLTTEYEGHIANIQKEFPLVPEQWASMRAVLEEIKSHDQLLTDNPSIPVDSHDHPFIKTIKETLASYTIDPARVTIELVDKPQSFMAAGQGYEKGSVRHFLRINLEAIAKKSEDVQLAFLKHEIMHLLNYDGIEGMFIKDLLKKNGITAEQISSSPSLIAFKKFQEYRADLLAADSPEIAASLIKDFEKVIALHPYEQVNPSHTSHPTETQRKEAVTHLLSYLNAETNTKLA